MGSVLQVDGDLPGPLADYDGSIVKFGSPTCRPCHALDPVLQRLADEREELKIYSVNVEEAPETAKRFGVRGIPVMFMVKDGGIAAKMVGARSLEQLRDWYLTNA